MHTHTHTHTHTNMHVYAYANMPPPANKQWGVWSTRSLTSKLINLLKNIFSTKLEYFYTDPPLDSCPSLLLFSPSYTLLLTFFSSPLTSIILLSYYFLLLLSCYPSIHPIFLLIHFLLSSLQWLGVRLDSIYRLGCPFLRSEARRYSWIESIGWSQTEGNQSCRSSSDPFLSNFYIFPTYFIFVSPIFYMRLRHLWFFSISFLIFFCLVFHTADGQVGKTLCHRLLGWGTYCMTKRGTNLYRTILYKTLVCNTELSLFHCAMM